MVSTVALVHLVLILLVREASLCYFDSLELSMAPLFISALPLCSCKCFQGLAGLGGTVFLHAYHRANMFCMPKNALRNEFLYGNA